MRIVGVERSAALLVPVLALCGCRTIKPANGLTADAFPITVGHTVKVSNVQPGWEHAEYMADADPMDANRVMVCSMRSSQDENRLTAAVYNSFDAGSTWTMMVDSSTAARFGGVWDPACEYGNDGRAIFVTLLLSDTAIADTTNYQLYEHWRMGGDGRMHVFRSDDGGQNWSAPVVLSMIDREEIKVDRTSGPYRGRIYIYGRYSHKDLSNRAFWLIYSDDDGRTWKKSAEHRPDGGSFDGAYPMGEILPDGTLFFLWRWTPKQEEGQRPQKVTAYMVSNDGGITFSEPAVIPGTSANPSASGLAVDRSGGRFHGRIYAMFSVTFRGRTAFQVMHSDDIGKSWSRPVRATDPRAIRREPGERIDERAMPQIAVNEDGIVGITWYDWEERVSFTQAHLRFTASTDGGESWLPSVRVSDVPLVVRKERPEFSAKATVTGGGQRARRQPADSIDVFLWPSPRAYYTWNQAPGDYTGIAAGADGAFHTFWIGTSNGRAELYTARVTVNGILTAADGGLLAGLDTITRRVEFQVTSSVWDPEVNSVRIAYQLLNTSPDTIHTPILVRLAQIESHLGNPTLILGKDERAWSGAIIDVSPLVPGSGLAPDQTTSSQALHFVLDDVNGLFNPDRDILHLKIEVYGRRQRAQADYE